MLQLCHPLEEEATTTFALSVSPLSRKKYVPRRHEELKGLMSNIRYKNTLLFLVQGSRPHSAGQGVAPPHKHVRWGPDNGTSTHTVRGTRWGIITKNHQIHLISPVWNQEQSCLTHFSTGSQEGNLGGPNEGSPGHAEAQRENDDCRKHPPRKGGLGHCRQASGGRRHSALQER